MYTKDIMYPTQLKCKPTTSFTCPLFTIRHVESYIKRKENPIVITPVIYFI